jgi:hypothetical protein
MIWRVKALLTLMLILIIAPIFVLISLMRQIYIELFWFFKYDSPKIKERMRVRY